MSRGKERTLVHLYTSSKQVAGVAENGEATVIIYMPEGLQ